jgi:hypothetical protein
MRTTLSNSVTFNSDGTVFSQDGTILNKAVQNPSAMSDAQKANIGITINRSDFASYQQHTGAQQGTSSTRVQLLHDDGLVKIGGHEVRPEVAETLKRVAPSLFVDPSVKAAEAAKVTDEAREEDATREELGRHADDTLEGYHQHVVGEVSTQNLIGLLVYDQKGEAPSETLLQGIAREMGEPIGTAIDKVNAVAAGVHRQFTNLATAMGLNPESAAIWLKEHRKDSSMVATQAHFMRRDVRSWLPLLEDYRASTGDGVRH